MDNNIQNQQSSEAASLEISMQVNSRVIRESGGTEVKIPCHFRQISVYNILNSLNILNQALFQFDKMIKYLAQSKIKQNINYVNDQKSQKILMFYIIIVQVVQYKMEVESKNSHYVHTIQHPHSQRIIVKSYHSFENGNHSEHIAIVNHNTIEVYRNVGSSIVYHKTYNFMCDISLLEVIPVKGETSDVLFLADEMGRFMFWSPQLGSLSANNNVRSPQYLAPFYLKAPAQDKQPQFSGIYHTFNLFDTQATIFFTVLTKLILLKIKWSKNKIFFVCPPQEIQCPYLDINFINIIKGKEPYIGIVEQRQEKSFLRIHRANLQNFECISTIQKSNLSAFYGTNESDEIITVTNSQLSIYNLKTQQAFCNFQISQPGFVSPLGPDLYLFVGQLGSQMIVFSKKKYKNYGSFMVENQVCMKVCTHGQLTDGGFLVSVIDQGHTVEFIALYEQSWRSIRSIFSTAAIFTIQDMERKNQCLAVVRVGENIHQVGVLSKRISAKLQKQTIFKSSILSLYSANAGRAVIVSCYDSNSVLIYDEEQQTFEVGFEFEPGIIVAVLDKYVVMQKKIYQMDLVNNSIKQLWAQKSSIVAADFNGKFIGFECLDFNYKFYNTVTKQIDRIRKNCIQQYIWRFHTNQCVVIGRLDMLGKLTILPVFKQATIVNINCNELITDILSYGNLLLISFNNCNINVYNFEQMNIIQSINCSAQPLQLLLANHTILAYGSNQAYFLNKQAEDYFTIDQIEFDVAKQNTDVVYLSSLDKFIVSHQMSLALYSFHYIKSQASSFRVISMNVGINSNDINLPFTTLCNGKVYVACTYQIIMRNANTAELLKKQRHCLKEVCAIEKLQLGLLVVGIDDMDNAALFLFDYADLQIVFTQNLNKKTPTAIKRKDLNSFFLRQENVVTLYEIKKQLSLKQIFSTKIGLNGYTLAIQPYLSMLLASDPLRYLVVYDYRLNKLVSLCRYQNLNTINDADFIDNAVAIGDCAGNLSIAQFNFDKGEVVRTTMTEVGSLKLGSEIIQVRKGKQGVIYSTISGSVGRVRAIDAEKFAILKLAQKQGLYLIQQNKNELKYQQWVNRPNLADKLIDGFLIDCYLGSKKESKSASYKQVEEIWANLK